MKHVIKQVIRHDLKNTRMKENKKSPEKSPARLLPGVLFIAILIVVDQITKIMAVRFLGGGQKVILIPGVLEFTLIHNSGAAFGILQNAMLFFYIITAAALVVIVFILARTPSGRRYLPMRLCLCFIAAGAVGNLIDRAVFSYVRDFIYFSLIDFPVFNVADIYITCAAFTMVLLTIFYYTEESDFSFLSLKGE